MRQGQEVKTHSLWRKSVGEKSLEWVSLMLENIYFDYIFIDIEFCDILCLFWDWNMLGLHESDANDKGSQTQYFWIQISPKHE